jgi:hypothetical protein
MIKRLLFVFVYALTLPIAIVCMLITVVIMPIVCLVLYIAIGDKDDTLMDLMYSPYMWAVNLPYKITGND